jgi:hypothetical protein
MHCRFINSEYYKRDIIVLNKVTIRMLVILIHRPKVSLSSTCKSNRKQIRSWRFKRGKILGNISDFSCWKKKQNFFYFVKNDDGEHTDIIL